MRIARTSPDVARGLRTGAVARLLAGVAGRLCRALTAGFGAALTRLAPAPALVCDALRAGGAGRAGPERADFPRGWRDASAGRLLLELMISWALAENRRATRFRLHWHIGCFWRASLLSSSGPASPSSCRARVCRNRPGSRQYSADGRRIRAPRGHRKNLRTLIARSRHSLISPL